MPKKLNKAGQQQEYVPSGNGTHIHAEEGESKEQAMGKKFKGFGKNKGQKEEKGLKVESRSMVNEKQANDPRILADKLDKEDSKDKVDSLYKDAKEKNLSFERMLLNDIRNNPDSYNNIVLGNKEYKRVGNGFEFYEDGEYVSTGTVNSVASDINSYYEKKEIKVEDSAKDGKVATNDKEIQEQADKIRSSGDSFTYQMLDRLRSDMEYVLGIPKNYPNAKITKDSFNQLWYENEPYKHLALMRNLYDGLKEKPEWLKREKIDEFENEVNKHLGGK